MPPCKVKIELDGTLYVPLPSEPGPDTTSELPVDRVVVEVSASVLLEETVTEPKIEAVAAMLRVALLLAVVVKPKFSLTAAELVTAICPPQFCRPFRV